MGREGEVRQIHVHPFTTNYNFKEMTKVMNN